MRKTDLLRPFLLFFLILPLGALEPAASFYERGEDGSLLLQVRPSGIPEDLIRHSIEDGHLSELFFTFRIQAGSGGFFLRGEHREIRIRKTGFRDRITGDYILLLNGREVAVYRDWVSFFRLFTAPFAYSSGLPWGEDSRVRLRESLIYKKLVPPFNLLYLLPGKFMRQGAWMTVAARGGT